MGRTFVIGDIHGAFHALRECLIKAEFDYSNDQLICLGDVCDGWPDVKLCIDELLKIKYLIYIMGNHDVWALDWFMLKRTSKIWLTQGGNSTIKSYSGGIPQAHIDFLTNAKDYYSDKNRLFVHGGIDLDIPFEDQGREIFLWNRSLVQIAAFLSSIQECTELSSFSEIYVGHTPVLNFNSAVPLKFCNVWLMDTGAGWQGGCLSMMDINSGKVTMSSIIDKFYPHFRGRGKDF